LSGFPSPARLFSPTRSDRTGLFLILLLACSGSGLLIAGGGRECLVGRGGVSQKGARLFLSIPSQIYVMTKRGFLSLTDIKLD